MKIKKKINQAFEFIKNYRRYKTILANLEKTNNQIKNKYEGCNLEINKEVAKKLLSLGKFSFLPNSGNLGDFLIAKGEFNFFKTHHLDFEIFDKKSPIQNNTFVYGGGGVFVSYWDYSHILKIFQNKAIKKIVILPSSFYECDDLISNLDERFTVFCREERSYKYLQSKQTKAEILLAEDMALVIKKQEKEYSYNKDKISAKDIFRIETNLYIPYIKIYQAITSVLKIKNIRGYKVGFFMRKDKEKNINNAFKSLDISLAAVGNCSDESFTNILSSLFLSSIDCVDIVISDRLHVCIAGAILNKKVLMIDNSYKKLSEVYKHSLSDYKNVKCIKVEDISKEIDSIKNIDKTEDNTQLKDMNYVLEEFVKQYFSYKTNNKIEKMIWSEPNV